MKQEEAKPEIIRLWQMRPAEEKSGVHVIEFYWWLQQNHPELLSFRYKNDKYQLIAAWLKDFLSKP